MPNLRARPAVRRVNRTIHVPKVVRAAIKPDKKVLKKIRTVNKASKSANKPAPAVVSGRVKLQSVGKAQNQLNNRIKKKRKTVVKHISRDISDASKKKLREIRGTQKGRILVIVGNGPSVLEIELGKLRSQPRVDVMSINKPDGRVWPTKHWLFCDGSQLKRHLALWEDYKGHIFNTTAIKEKKNSIQIKNLGGEGFSKDLLKGFHVGRSSVYAAMQVALWLGYDHVFIVGVDMRSVTIDGKEMMHYYGVNPDVKPEHRAKRFDNEAKYYNFAARTLSEAERSRFTFCSSYLKYEFAKKFNVIGHKDAARVILDTASCIGE